MESEGFLVADGEVLGIDRALARAILRGVVPRAREAARLPQRGDGGPLLAPERTVRERSRYRGRLSV
jgi:hypothetical protein